MRDCHAEPTLEGSQLLSPLQGERYGCTTQSGGGAALTTGYALLSLQDRRTQPRWILIAIQHRSPHPERITHHVDLPFNQLARHLLDQAA